MKLAVDSCGKVRTVIQCVGMMQVIVDVNKEVKEKRTYGWE